MRHSKRTREPRSAMEHGRSLHRPVERKSERITHCALDRAGERRMSCTVTITVGCQTRRDTIRYNTIRPPRRYSSAFSTRGANGTAPRALAAATTCRRRVVCLHRTGRQGEDEEGQSARARDQRTTDRRFGVSRTSAGRAGSPCRATKAAVVGRERAVPRHPTPPRPRPTTPPARLPLSPVNGTPFSISLFSISLPWGPRGPLARRDFYRETQGRFSSAGNEIDNAKRNDLDAYSNSTAMA